MIEQIISAKFHQKIRVITKERWNDNRMIPQAQNNKVGSYKSAKCENQ